jgi:hypothetical protein
MLLCSWSHIAAQYRLKCSLRTEYPPHVSLLKIRTRRRDNDQVDLSQCQVGRRRQLWLPGGLQRCAGTSEKIRQ